MKMFRKHTSPLLVIIAGLLSCIATAAAQQQNTYYFCTNQQSNIYINSSSSAFFIRSPNYPGVSYGNNLNCLLVIISGAEPLVLALRIKDFQVENCDCRCDYLCVHGAKFCGASLSGNKFQYILPGYSRFTLIFNTDYSVTLRGFEIEISQELARTNYVVPQITVEVVSVNYTMSNNFETYYPGYPYSDRWVRGLGVGFYYITKTVCK